MALGLLSEQEAVVIKAATCELNGDRQNNTCLYTVWPEGLRQKTKSIDVQRLLGRHIEVYHYMMHSFFFPSKNSEEKYKGVYRKIYK